MRLGKLSSIKSSPRAEDKNLAILASLVDFEEADVQNVSGASMLCERIKKKFTISRLGSREGDTISFNFEWFVERNLMRPHSGFDNYAGKLEWTSRFAHTTQFSNQKCDQRI